jgi:hypothetical protein
LALKHSSLSFSIQFTLRRTKSLIADQLPRKTDEIVFCRMSELQTRAYGRLLDSPDFKLLRHCECGSGDQQYLCCSPRDESTDAAVLNAAQAAAAGSNRSAENSGLPLGSPLAAGSASVAAKHADWLALCGRGVIWRRLHPFGTMCPDCPACIALPCVTVLSKLANHLDLLRPEAGAGSSQQHQQQLEQARLPVAKRQNVIVESEANAYARALTAVALGDEAVERGGSERAERSDNFGVQMKSAADCGKVRHADLCG